jgi:hypothetical protein
VSWRFAANKTAHDLEVMADRAAAKFGFIIKFVD